MVILVLVQLCQQRRRLIRPVLAKAAVAAEPPRGVARLAEVRREAVAEVAERLIVLLRLFVLGACFSMQVRVLQRPDLHLGIVAVEIC